MTADLIDAVMQFDEGTYLHQTVVNGKRGLTRYVDLADAVAAFRRGEADGEWRIHCHVPIFLPDLGKLGSTRDILVSTLKDLRRRHRSSHLEVETYTWDVLPQELRTGSKADDIARELSFELRLRRWPRAGPPRRHQVDVSLEDQHAPNVDPDQRLQWRPKPA